MEKVAVLASGGLDSSILLADLAESCQVFPIYVQKGLAWENQERKALRSFLGALESPNVQPTILLSVPVHALYNKHWSLSGDDIPSANTPDNAVFLPGRNILLLGLAAIWCSTHDVSRIAIGSLKGNPFEDATPEFFDRFANILSIGLAHPIIIDAPYRERHKEDLVRCFRHLPLELTLTCIAPRGGSHCGQCNKCYERHLAFTKAGVPERIPFTLAAKRR